MERMGMIVKNLSSGYQITGKTNEDIYIYIRNADFILYSLELWNAKYLISYEVLCGRFSQILPDHILQRAKNRAIIYKMLLDLF